MEAYMEGSGMEGEIGSASASARARARKVTLSTRARVLFTVGGVPDGDAVEVPKDLYSVMDAILARLASTKSMDELGSARVSVRSFEDPALSEPVQDGEARYEGPYGVAGLEIEDMLLQDAVSALAGAVVPSDEAVRQVEAACSQLFLRSRLDSCSFVFASGGHAVSSTMVNSLRDVDPRSVAALHATLLRAASELRESVSAQFPDMEVDWDGAGTSAKADGVPASELVLPSGLPASMAGKGVVTPGQIRAAGPRMVVLD